MASPDLTPFSYVVLTLVGRNGAGPHDLVRMARQGRVHWSAAESQYYAEPKRLEKLGYLRAEKRPGRTRERTQYTLTDAGRAALMEWAAEPARFPRIQHEAANADAARRHGARLGARRRAGRTARRHRPDHRPARRRRRCRRVGAAPGALPATEPRARAPDRRGPPCVDRRRRAGARRVPRRRPRRPPPSRPNALPSRRPCAASSAPRSSTDRPARSSRGSPRRPRAGPGLRHARQ